MDPHPNTVNLSVPVLPSSDLQMQLTANAEPILAGQELTYTYTVTNNGPSAATGVVITDVLPPDTVLVASPPNSNGGDASLDVDPDTGVQTLTIQVGDLALGTVVTGTFTIRPTVLDGNANSRRLTNSATVSGNEGDPKPGDNKAMVVTTVSPADLSVRMTATPPRPRSGRISPTPIIVTTTARPPPRTSRSLTSLPAGVTFVSGASSKGWSPIPRAW